MDWNKQQQARHAALHCWRFLLNGAQRDLLELGKELEIIGFTGCIQSLSPESIIREWEKAGWIKISPNGHAFRLTETGVEQFHHWKEEDELWNRGPADNIKYVKRLHAGQPAMNLRKIAQLIGTVNLTSVHDPYTTEATLMNLHKLKGMGVPISQNLRLLTAPKKALAATSVASFLQNINSEIAGQWELRAYTGVKKPHRRFLILQDKSVITCGLSLNEIDKDEALDHISASDDDARFDNDFFDKHWVAATPIK